ncbi:putative membrane protein [Paenibacillus algicola]|uniref:Putative membrane protein n=1 Tax=Paenibacillus algicola TaxID=2565926 RepID=A0A4P8XUI7_9BACL|nr:DUF2705 family protein [Paenibacillus algicola]QCT04479.1 putative membrane protein [Paenibacillus algicola]
MRSFVKLTINEWLKMFKKKSFVLPYALLAAMAFGIAYLIDSFASGSSTTLEFAQLAVSTQGMGQMMTLLAIVSTAGLVSMEFSFGTIKLLLVRAQSRSKILASKYTAILMYLVTLAAFTLAAGLAAGALFFEASGGNMTFIDLLWSTLYSLVYTLLYVTITFVVSIVTRSTGAAIGIGMFLIVAQGLANQLLTRYNWYKYLPFVNVDLSIYRDGGTGPLPGMSLTFSASLLAVYLLLFLAVGFWTFHKRDVA